MYTPSENILRKYARLIAVMGANVQKGQSVIIRCDVAQHAFAALVTEACYACGAGKVRVDWTDQKQTRLAYQWRTTESLSQVEEWRKAQLQEMVDELPARIYISSEDPDGLKGMDMEKLQAVRRATYPITRPYSDAIENRTQWTIAAVPSPAWAKKMFPELDEEDAVAKLWEAILASVHVTEDNDPVEAWKKHNANFAAHSKWLNDQRFEYVTYKSANGTDFRADLIPEGTWCGGIEETISGLVFNPNMPTEEIFTTPMKGKAEGTLVATKPLSWNGQLIDGFSITFKDGRAVEWEAAQGKELLDKMITMDEGAAMLGELALVPCSSPICQSGLLFYETLFDENAACHVALGRGFNDCIEGYQHRTDEECKALGVNDSMIHVDFMIGCEDLCITGWKNGCPTPIFVDGEWAVEL